TRAGASGRGSRVRELSPAAGQEVSCTAPKQEPAGLDTWLRQQNRVTVFAAGIALVAWCGYLDHLSTRDIGPLIYLAPVVLVAWYAGAWYGDAIALISGVAWLASRGHLPALSGGGPFAPVVGDAGIRVVALVLGSHA